MVLGILVLIEKRLSGSKLQQACIELGLGRAKRRAQVRKKRCAVKTFQEHAKAILQLRLMVAQRSALMAAHC